MNVPHVPVLLNETIEYLVTNKNGIYFDGTIGFGGHSSIILSKLDEQATLIGTDVDEEAFLYVKNRFQGENRIKLYKYNFTFIDKIAIIESLAGFDGIFVDLGVSSYQLDTPEEGFSYRNDSPLDLRLDKTLDLNAADLINGFEEEEIVDILFTYGEEKNSKKIAREIISTRKVKKIETTLDLVKIIERITPAFYLSKSLSRVFQALRIYINDELEKLELFLNTAIRLLNGGGRLVVLSYHSLEDRIVKETFKYQALDCICPKEFPVCRCDKRSTIKILTKKPVVPGEEEIKNNNRSRSAKLRAAEKLC